MDLIKELYYEVGIMWLHRVELVSRISPKLIACLVQATLEEDFNSVVESIVSLVQEHATADPSDFLQYFEVCLRLKSMCAGRMALIVASQIGTREKQANVGLPVDQAAETFGSHHHGAYGGH